MTTLPERLRMLLGEPKAARAAIIAGALPAARPAELRTLAAEILQLGDSKALAAVIREIHRFPAEAATLIQQPSPAWPLALAATTGETDRQTLLNAVEVIRLLGDPQHLFHLVDLLQRRRPEVAERAAAALLSVTIRLLGTDGRRAVDNLSMKRLDLALGAAALSYREHRLDDVLLALAVASTQPGPNVADLLRDPEHPAIQGIRSLVRQAVHPLVRSNLIHWLRIDTLATAIVRGLHQLDGPEAYRDFLFSAHLLRLPSRRRNLQSAERPAIIPPAPSIAGLLPTEAQQHLPLLIRSLNLSAATKAAHLGSCITLSAPLARLLAVAELLRHDPEHAAAPLASFAFDAAEPIATLAAGSFLAEDAEPTETLVHLARSPHPSVATEARRRLAGSSPEMFFRVWLTVPLEQRLLAAITLLATQRERFLELLGARITKPAPAEQREAIALLRRLRLTMFADALVDALAGPDAHVASAAAAALSNCEGRTVAAALHTAAQHADPRVRANAMQSMFNTPSLRADALDLAAAMRTAREQRPRATAIRTQLAIHHELGIEGLQRMLADHDPVHRRSALWAARTGRAGSVLPLIRALASTDPSPIVRRDAATTARVLAFRSRMNDHHFAANGA